MTSSLYTQSYLILTYAQLLTFWGTFFQLISQPAVVDLTSRSSETLFYWLFPDSPIFYLIIPSKKCSSTKLKLFLSTLSPQATSSCPHFSDKPLFSLWSTSSAISLPSFPLTCLWKRWGMTWFLNSAAYIQSAFYLTSFSRKSIKIM